MLGEYHSDSIGSADAQRRDKGPRLECGYRMMTRSIALIGGLISVASLFGCGRSPAPQYELNRVVLRTQAKDLELDAREEREYGEQINTILVALFGTPDEPVVPPGSGLDERKVKMASGPVGGRPGTPALGLFREHCVHCHGITGDGRGPTARYLNPYPRDYRQGVFKAKGTTLEARPRRADLRRLLMEGVAGTSMPSFKLLAENEVEALVEYVKYLSIRGEVEQSLLYFLLPEFVEGEPLPTDAATLLGFVEEAAAGWDGAEDAAVDPPSPPEMDLAESIRLGRELFMSEAKGGCVKCHGELALGDGQLDGFDVWNEAVQNFAADDPVAARQFALPPRNIRPRNLRQGIYRFGRRPLDLYRRIHEGIAGTPMPGVGATPGITKDDIWHLVHYVQSLPYEALSRPRHEATGATKERL